ncbi:hypothetical protein VitviT2T_025509 [Vitis vinifera]|uniref:Uncharacterized protein n=1 Tax=Vitis vinifera TaxID=29760 RepID=A0ABY9DM94_VITVI|nr:hypothetical protein VitviT2T_025509 [Vitis vinifera]
MLPPHEIVARSHVMTFSVVEGVGRTLKGRDLRRVRNAVFQKTENRIEALALTIWSGEVCCPYQASGTLRGIAI